MREPRSKSGVPTPGTSDEVDIIAAQAKPEMVTKRRRRLALFFKNLRFVAFVHDRQETEGIIKAPNQLCPVPLENH
jgi:hypothetical protein